MSSVPRAERSSPSLLSRFQARLPIGSAIYAVFFVESSVLGQWIPRIPDIKRSLGLDDAELGLALLCMPLATLVGLSLSAWLIERIGLRNACRAFLPLWAVLFVLPGIVASFAQLCLALGAAGVAIGMIETAMNTEAARQETHYRTRMMSRCHGFWSLGSMVGALSGGLIAQWGIGTGTHFLIVMPVLAVLGYAVATQLPEPESDIKPAVAPTVVPATQRRRFSWPTRALLPLCIMPVGLMMLEGVFIDWSAVFVREVLAGSPLAVAVIYAAFSAVMALTRLFGDALAERLGDVRVVRLSALCGLFGAATFALSPNVAVAFIGAALAGAGVAVVFPLAVSAAARRTDRPSADNVASLNMISFSAFLFAPPLIGFLSEAASLRIAILALVPGALLSFYLSRELVRDRVPVSPAS